MPGPSVVSKRTAANEQQYCGLAAIFIACISVVSGCAVPVEKTARSEVVASTLPADSLSDLLENSLWEPQTVRPVNFLPQENDNAQITPVENSGLNDSVRATESDPSERLSAIRGPVENEGFSDLQSLIDTAVAVHPSIAAARQRLASVNNRIPQATALEDPTLSNTFWPIHNQALQTAGGRVGHQFALTQKVPWPAKLDARGAVAQREVQMAQADVLSAEREVVEAVRLAYYELWLADELIRIVEDNKDLVDDLILVSEARYKTGGTQQDVLRAELEADKLEEQLISLRRQKEQARADLGTLVRQPIHLMPTAYSDLNVATVAPQLDLLVSQAEQCNPTLQGLAAEIARDRAKQTVACLQQYPDFQLGLGYSIISDDDNVISPVANGHDNINFTIGVTLPVWRDKINAGVREAAHQQNSTINRREAERDRLRGQLRRQVAAADAAIEQLELFHDRLIPRTEQALEVAIADYQGENADFIDLVDIYRELLTYQVQIARARATLFSTLARVERIVGCEVPMADLP